MSVRVCAAGEFTSELAEVYLGHVSALGGDRAEGGGGEEERRLAEAFRCLQLNVSLEQASQILSLARECTPVNKTADTATGGQEPTLPPPTHTSPSLSWSEFCVFTVELHTMLLAQEQNREKGEMEGQGREKEEGGEMVPHSPRQSGIKNWSKAGTSDVGLRRQCSCNCEVFLGGSCNPTTWRKDVAIPMLKRNGITYFNPQVEAWYPELIEIEEKAKQAADTLLFVVDNQTRAVSSMVEIAYFAGVGRSMILVVQDFKGEAPKVGADVLSPREVKDLNRGRAFVRALAEEAGSLLDKSVNDAVHSAVTCKMLKSSEDVFSHTSRTRPHRLKRTHTLGEELRLLQQVFVLYNMEKSGSLSVEEAVLALQSLGIDTRLLAGLVEGGGSGSHDHLSSWQQHGISFEDFCTLYSELRLSMLHEAGGGWRQWAGLGVFLSRLVTWMSAWLWPPSLPLPPHICDVFLGGSCGSTTWRNDIAIPILRQHGVSYFNPQIADWDPRLIPIERQAREQTSVMLQAISGDTLSVASMVEAAYYIGRRRKVVLYLTDIPRGASLEADGIKLSDRAIRDYNRGRAYLASIANNSHVPIFTSITDAILCAVYLVKGYRLPPAGSLPLSGTSV